MEIRLKHADESRIYSQHGEDGVLRRITSLLGDLVPRTFVEFGAHPKESNTLALRKAGWDGVMLDQQGGEGIIAAHITRDNVNDLIAQHFGCESCGILSIDLDGNDYWIVDAITVLEPVITVVEYNAAFDAEIKVATPYQEPRQWTGGCDYSATLNAWASLHWRKWQARLCYVESTASNAFFVCASAATGRLDLSRTTAELMVPPRYSYGDPFDFEWERVE